MLKKYSAKILGLQNRPIKKPLIEIVGPVDSGKRKIGYLLSKRLDWTFFPFPNLRLDSAVGLTLLQKLRRTPDHLLQNPYWWLHVYSAGIYDFAGAISEASAVGGVCCINYLVGQRCWMQIAGVGIDGLQGCQAGLKRPDWVFVLPYQNLSTEWSDNVKTQWPEGFEDRVAERVRRLVGPGVIHVPDLSDPKSVHNTLNNTTDWIQNYLASRTPLTPYQAYYSRDEVF